MLLLCQRFHRHMGSSPWSHWLVYRGWLAGCCSAVATALQYMVQGSSCSSSPPLIVHFPQLQQTTVHWSALFSTIVGYTRHYNLMGGGPPYTACSLHLHLHLHFPSLSTSSSTSIFNSILRTGRDRRGQDTLSLAQIPSFSSSLFPVSFLVLYPLAPWPLPWTPAPLPLP